MPIIREITEQITVVKKKHISFNKVNLKDMKPEYANKLKDKGVKYYSKYKVDGKDRTIISVKLVYKDYEGNDKTEDCIIVTKNTFKNESEIDAFVEENITHFERDKRNDRASKLRNDIEEATGIAFCKTVFISEEYE